MDDAAAGDRKNEEKCPMLDEIYDVDDYSQIAIQAMIDRLERSTTEEHYIYRETELDEMWRLVDISLGIATASERHGLSRLKAAIMRAHDLVGVDGKPIDAARALRNLQG
jgi:hypothetical protein